MALGPVCGADCWRRSWPWALGGLSISAGLDLPCLPRLPCQALVGVHCVPPLRLVSVPLPCFLHSPTRAAAGAFPRECPGELSQGLSARAVVSQACPPSRVLWQGGLSQWALWASEPDREQLPWSPHQLIPVAVVLCVTAGEPC